MSIVFYATMEVNVWGGATTGLLVPVVYDHI